MLLLLIFSSLTEQNCKCCQYKGNHLYSYSLYIVECIFVLPKNVFAIDAVHPLFGVRPKICSPNIW